MAPPAAPGAINLQTFRARKPLSKKTELRELAEQYYDRLFRSALVMCGDDDVAEELVQDTFLAAAKGLDRFEGRSSYYTWLYGILLNKFRGWLRKKDRPPMSLERHAEKLSASGAAELVEAEGEEASEKLMKKETAHQVRAALDELPAHHRSVLVLRYVENMSYQEIADTVGCSLGTVKSRIHYALKKVGGKLRELEVMGD
jgi:RNA polymerase sigma-70 factor (ECF subfamily)